MTSRRVREQDLDLIAQLYVRVFNGAPWNDHWTRSGARKRLLDIYRTPRFVGTSYVSGGRIVAAVLGNTEIWYERRHFQLKEMFVDPEFQRTGVGSRMLGELIPNLRRKGVGGVYLFTSTSRWTGGFYRKNGFQALPKMQMMRISL